VVLRERSKWREPTGELAERRASPYDSEEAYAQRCGSDRSTIATLIKAVCEDDATADRYTEELVRTADDLLTQHWPKVQAVAR
jgi:hypothetical protein